MLFSPTSFWNTPIPANPQIDGASVGAVDWLAQQSHTINYDHYTIPIYRVSANQATQRVQVGRKVVAGGFTQAAINGLQAAWEHVPLPAGAKPSLGKDMALTVIRGNELWDFFGFAWQADGSAKSGWGGYIPDITTHPGVFTVADHQGASAPGFPGVGGLITVPDCEAGAINHALGICVPSKRGFLARPALRTDGPNEAADSLLEGARLQLDPALDISHLPAFTQMMARAAQRFGVIVKDYSSAAPFIVEDCSRLGAANPFTKPGGFFGGVGAQALAQAFPWTHLRLLKMEVVKYP